MPKVNGLTRGYHIDNIIREIIDKNLKPEVHSVQRNSFYVEVYTDNLFLVTDQVYGALPFGISIDIQQQNYFDQIGLETGLSVLTEKSSFYIPEIDFCIDLKNSNVWYPKDILHYKTNLPIFNSNLNHLIEYSKSKVVEEKGLINLIIVCDDIYMANKEIPAELDYFRKISFNLLIGLTKGIKNEDYPRITQALNKLIGFGVGLTPYMDDVVVGLISSLHIFKDKLFLTNLVSFLGSELFRLKDRTTSVSKLYLMSAVKGDVFEIIDQLIYAVIFSEQSEIRARVDRLLTVGSTSGAGLLLGIVLGFKYIADTQKSCHLNMYQKT